MESLEIQRGFHETNFLKFCMDFGDGLLKQMVSRVDKTACPNYQNTCSLKEYRISVFFGGNLILAYFGSPS